MQWPAGDQKEENDIEDDESEDEDEAEIEKKSNFVDLYGINYWNYESLDS